MISARKGNRPQKKPPTADFEYESKKKKKEEKTKVSIDNIHKIQYKDDYNNTRNIFLNKSSTDKSTN